MWQRFTELARKAIFYAQEEAQRFGEGYVSTEHILLGLTREPSTPACVVLKEMHITLTQIRAEIEITTTSGKNRPNQDMTLTPRAKRTIDLAYEEARNFGHDYIGTEHLLLGLIREGDGIAGRVLHKLGADLEVTRKAVLANLGDAPGDSTHHAAKVSNTGISSSPERSWRVLSARRQRMPADQLCLMCLYEAGSAAQAVQACGATTEYICLLIEEEMLVRKTPDELVAGFLGVSVILKLAQAEAEMLNQEIAGHHFLLAALKHGDNATARALTYFDVTYDVLHAWAEQKPM